MEEDLSVRLMVIQPMRQSSNTRIQMSELSLMPPKKKSLAHVTNH